MATTHRLRLLAGLAVGALALAACGGDDGDSVQNEVADMLIEQMQGETDVEGISMDEDCVRDVAGELSDDDAQAIIDAGPDGDPDISMSGEELGMQLVECFDIDLGDIDLDDIDTDG